MKLRDIMKHALEASVTRMQHAEDHERDNQEEDETTGNRAADIASVEVGEPDSSVNEEDDSRALPPKPAFPTPPPNTEEQERDTQIK